MVEMILVEGGTFQMGCENGDSSEAPIHRVTVNGFWMGKFAVTNQLWYDAFGMKSAFGRENLPRVNVSFLETIAFCNKLSLNEGLKPCYRMLDQDIFCDFISNGYRLPTEAEWEFAAKGGNQSGGFLYSGSNNADEVAWYEDNSEKQLHGVGLKRPNELGIYDLSGNVYEFCWDVFEDYHAEDQINPTGPDKNTINLRRVIRGGNCFGFAYRVRCTSRRKGLFHQYSQDFVGIRLARSCENKTGVLAVFNIFR